MSRSQIFGYISTVALAATVLVATPAIAAVSCITINKYYEHGVSASKHSRNIGNDLVGSPRVKTSIYKKYAHLDLDKDKIVCEIEASLPALPYSEQVIENAILEVSRGLGRTSDMSFDITSHSFGDFSDASIEATIRSTRLGVQYLSTRYEFSKADFIFFSKNEVSQAQAKWNEITSGTRLFGLEVYGEEWFFPCRGAEYTYEKEGQTRYITYQCDDGNQNDPVNFGAHGTIHWYQGLFNVHTMPNWLVEGSATFYGEVIGYGVEDPRAKEVLWRGDYLLHNALKSGPSAIRAEIAKVSVANPSYSPSYTTSRMLYQALVGLHGEAKALDFIESFKLSSDADKNFLRIYGTTLESFYDEAIPLIADWAIRVWK